MTTLTAIRATETAGKERVGTLSLSGSTAPAGSQAGPTTTAAGSTRWRRARAQHVGRADRLEEARVAQHVLGAHPHHLVERQIEALAAVRPAVQHEGSGEVGLRARELVLGHRLAGQAIDLSPEAGLGRRHVLRRRPDVKHDAAGAPPGGVGRPHGVGEPLLVPEGPEEPARHPAAQDAVRDLEGDVVRRGDGRREIAEQDVGLLGRRRLVLTEAHGPLRRRRRRGHRPAAPEPFEEPSHLAEHVVGGHRPGHGEHEPVGRVCLPEPLEQARPRDPRDRRLLSARRQPVPPRAEERPREDAVGDLGGLVLETTDLGQEHPALPLDLVVREARLGGHLVEQREEAGPVSRETPGPQLAVLLIGPALDARPRRPRRRSRPRRRFAPASP